MNTPSAPDPTLTNLFQNAPPLPYRDRSGWLTAFGIVQVCIGILMAFLVPIVLVAGLASRQRITTTAHVSFGIYILAATCYAYLAVLLITLGYGSIQVRGWARAIILIVSWYWLFSGVLVTIFFAIFLPIFFRAQPQLLSDESSVAGTAVMLTMVVAIAAFFLILAPLIFAVFYSAKNVKQTFLNRDTKKYWTDRCALPVLAASLILAIGAGYHLVGAFTITRFPFFGIYLSGIWGKLGYFTLAAIDAFLARSLFKLRLSGWNAAVLIFILRIISLALVYAHPRVGLSSNAVIVFKFMGYYGMSHFILFLCYVIWLKKYFNNASAPQPAILASE